MPGPVEPFESGMLPVGDGNEVFWEASGNPTGKPALSEMILAAVTTTSSAEVAWITEDMGRVFPREWDRFADSARAEPGERLVDAYYRLLTQQDPGVREAAALAWCTWEDVHMSLDPKATPHLQHQTPEFRLLFATLVTHYWRNAGFGGDDLLDRMDRIAGTPAVLIHGRLDVSSPLSTAWNLAEAWPAAELVVVDQDGHGGSGITKEVERAVARFAPE
ncbi:alpha/beta hydrolase [Arthrobacter tecti]